MTTSTPTTRRRSAAALLLLGMSLLSSTAHAHDHGAWDDILRRFATPKGFRYAALAKDTAARAQLDGYMKQVGSMSDEAPLSAWLNAYNATVVSSIVKRYPIESVMKVPGFFKKIKHTIAGKQRTLDELEHGVIRKRFKDARIHVALNCGARSCPTLHPRALTEKGLSQTLEKLARAMVADSRHVQKRADGSVAVSALLFWFADDFKRDRGSPLGWLRHHGLAGVAKDARLTQLEYDWDLNLVR